MGAKCPYQEMIVLTLESQKDAILEWGTPLTTLSSPLDTPKGMNHETRTN